MENCATLNVHKSLQIRIDERDATPRRRDQVRVLKRPGLRFSPLGLMTSRVALKTHQGEDPYRTAPLGRATICERPARMSADTSRVPRDLSVCVTVNAGDGSHEHTAVDFVRA